MERAYNALKKFILEKVNTRLSFYEDAETALPQVWHEDISFGTADSLKSAGATLCAIWPEALEAAGANIAGEDSLEAEVTVTFFCRGAEYDELLRRACRYAAAFRDALRLDYGLNCLAETAEIVRVRFYPDCGTAERQAAASEIEMTIRLTEA